MRLYRPLSTIIFLGIFMLHYQLKGKIRRVNDRCLLTIILIISTVYHDFQVQKEVSYNKQGKFIQFCFKFFTRMFSFDLDLFNTFQLYKNLDKEIKLKLQLNILYLKLF
jgi:hypothetical protein